MRREAAAKVSRCTSSPAGAAVGATPSAVGRARYSVFRYSMIATRSLSVSTSVNSWPVFD
jgi:hypothetical protein